jgi:hypothetical protein
VPGVRRLADEIARTPPKCCADLSALLGDHRSTANATVIALVGAEPGPAFHLDGATAPSYGFWAR